MKLGIDITPLIYQRGVSRYTRNLAAALIDSFETEVHLFGYSLRKKSWLEKEAKQIFNNSKIAEKQTKILGLPQSIQSMLWRFGLNGVIKHMPQIDLFHSWDWHQPPDKKIPLVSTIHDLAILKYPETAHPKILKAHHRSWKILKEREAHIIAVSQATKKDIIDMLTIPPWRIHVVPEALPLEMRQISEDLNEEKYQQIIDKLSLNQPYILFVGTREPRKNLNQLIKAWQSLADDYQLIVVGAKGWGELDQKATSFNHPNLRFLGRVSDEQLSVLYAEAQVFAYPSLYEGFGLPILEAFYQGTPVLTSNLSSMIEVAGNAAELVDPQSVTEIRSALEKLVNEDNQQQQKRLQRMVIRLQMFNWRKVARQTIDVYQQAYEEFHETEIQQS